MSGQIKGITLTVGGDTTGLRKELSKVDKESASIQKELKEVEKSLKFDPKNTELLAQKQKLLADAIDATEDKLKEMKKAQERADQAIQNGTEISQKQYRMLQREISNTEAKLKGLKNQSKETNNEMADVEKPKKNLSDLKTTLGTATKAAGAFAAAGVAVAAGLSEIEESTREYRTDLSKLETNAKTANVSFDKMKNHLKSVVAITDETDSSIEALSNLLRTGFSESGLEKIIKELSGAVIAFPDTLKIESLADGLQETLATGNGVGQFSELLERCGINLDVFNQGLADAKKRGEEEQYILDTLAKTGMADINASYVETNANLIKIKESQQKWNDTMAAVGEVVTPVKAGIISFGADVISNLIGMNDETGKLVDSIKKENEAFWEAKEAQEAKLESNVAEIDYTIRLYDELDRLVDANGLVMEGNENRVSYILNELSEAIGIELELTGNQIQGYSDLSASIDEMLAKKRAEIILASQEEGYKKATLEIKAKEAEQSNLYISILEKEMEVREANAALNEASTSQERLSALGLQQDLISLKNAYEENDKVINQYYSDIYDYESNYQKLLSGSAEEIAQINSNVAESFKVCGEATEEELKKQVLQAANYYAEMQGKVDDGVKGFTQTLADEALIQYNNAVIEYEKIGKAIPDGMQVGIENGKPSLKIKVGDFITTVKSWFTNDDAFDINSPSGWGEDIGEFIDEGLANGIFKNIKIVQESFKELFGAVEEEHENLTKEEEKYNSELERIRQAGLDKIKEANFENLDAIAKGTEDRREIIKKAYEGMVEDVQKSIDDLNKSMESYRKGLSKVDLTETVDITLKYFDGMEIKKKITSLADLSGPKRELEKFRDNIIELQEMGIDDSMIEQIKVLGGDKGGLLAQALLDATQDERQQFIDDFKAIEVLSAEVTAEVYKDEIESAAYSTKELFEELNPDFLKIGEDWGTLLGNGLIGKLEKALKTLKNSMNYMYNDSLGSLNFENNGGRTVVFNTEINQNMNSYQPTSAFEIAEQTRRTMENLSDLVVLS